VGTSTTMFSPSGFPTEAWPSVSRNAPDSDLVRFQNSEGYNRDCWWCCRLVEFEQDGIENVLCHPAHSSLGLRLGPRPVKFDTPQGPLVAQNTAHQGDHAEYVDASILTDVAVKMPSSERSTENFGITVALLVNPSRRHRLR
jgi:hypothetical protein